MTCSICPSAKGPCSRCPVCLFEQTKDFPDENIAVYRNWTPDDFITDIVSKDAKIARLQEQVEAQLAETQRAWNEREGEKRGRLAAEAERDRLREAAILLLSEIDAGNDAEHINGATGPLRAALQIDLLEGEGLIGKPLEPLGREFEVIWDQNTSILYEE